MIILIVTIQKNNSFCYFDFKKEIKIKVFEKFLLTKHFKMVLSKEILKRFVKKRLFLSKMTIFDKNSGEYFFEIILSEIYDRDTHKNCVSRDRKINDVF
jgi:hypothetical protein